MNFLTLCQTMRQELGLSGTGPSSVVGQQGQQAQLIGFVQSADMLVKNLHADWNFLWDEWETSTVDGTSIYLPPATLGSWDVESFYLDWGTGEATKLIVETHKQDRMNTSERLSGRPEKVVFLPDGSLKLYPVPDDVYEISATFYKAPVPMTTNAAESEIPAQFHRIILARAKMLYSEAEEIYNQLQVYTMEYRETLNQLQSHSLEGQQYHWYGQPEILTVRTV